MEERYPEELEKPDRYRMQRPKIMNKIETAHMNDQEIEHLLKHFEESGKIEYESLSLQELERKGFQFVEHHKDNPGIYKTTEDWQIGYICGWLRMVDILRAKGYKEI